MGLFTQLSAWCRDELSRPAVRREFEALRWQHPALAPHQSPLDILVLLDRRLSAPLTVALHEQRDGVLLALLDAQRGPAAPRVPVLLLLVAFCPALSALSRRLSTGAGNEDVAAEVLDVFLDTAAAYPLASRRSRVAATLTHQTAWRLLRRRKHEQRRQGAERRVRLHQWLGQDGGSDRGYRDALLHLQARGRWRIEADDQVDAARALDVLVQRGVLSDLDRRLILETNVRERSLKTEVMADPVVGPRVSYEAARKRRQRALARVRQYLESEGLSITDLLGDDDF